MSRTLGPINLVTTAALTTALFLLASCKREERTFRVLPADAKATTAPLNAPQHVVGIEPAATTNEFLSIEYPSPPLGHFQSNAYELSQGKWLYQAMNCAGCHGVHGGGGIGPALSDDEWIHGWEPQVIFDSIVHGRPNGMPSFGGRISDHQVWQIVAYVRSLSGLGSRQAAPGRSDQMSSGTPPNSVRRATPRSSRVELEELEREEQKLFERLGWVDRESGWVRVPGSVVRAVAGTRPATQPSGDLRSPASQPGGGGARSK